MHHLSGDDFDKRVVDWLVSDFKQEINHDVKRLVYTDSAVAGGAVGIDKSFLLAETATKMASKMLVYAYETQHEKVNRGLTLGITLARFDREERVLLLFLQQSWYSLQGSKDDERVFPLRWWVEPRHALTSSCVCSCDSKPKEITWAYRWEDGQATIPNSQSLWLAPTLELIERGRADREEPDQRQNNQRNNMKRYVTREFVLVVNLVEKPKSNDEDEIQSWDGVQYAITS